MYNGIIMKKTLQKIMSGCSLLKTDGKLLLMILSMLIISSSSIAFAQNRVTVAGSVVDPGKEPIIGATVTLKSNPTIGATTDLDGKFSLQIPSGSQVLIFTYLGMNKKEVPVHGQRLLNVQMEEDNKVLNEVIVVGYGQQKKESVVGSITQTSGKVLERAGGVTNLGQALTGNLPGVVTTSSTGVPGAEDPKIVIRSQSSWNNSDPLVLVDGIERSLSSIDISSVETVSVLKDASATAVYGVRGANGVILITTKRGSEGKANIQIRANMTAKVVSKLPKKYDAYDTFQLLNNSIERELPLSSGGWSSYTPTDIINKYRYPANAEEWDRYPNVDWEKTLFKDYAMSYNTSVNVAGGTKTVKYFTAVDFVHEGDLFRTFENNRGYSSGYGYNRINVRSNLDFDLSKTTKFSANLFGSNGVRTLPWVGAAGNESDQGYWASAYRTAPDAMRPIYSNGAYGFYGPRDADVPNSVYNLAISGIEKSTKTQITTDFILNQDLGTLVKGMSVKANISLDNSFQEYERGINDLYHYAQQIWVDPATGIVKYKQPVNSGTQLDFAESVIWAPQAGNVNLGATFRKVYYSGQLNYARKFGKHDVTGMGLFSREKYTLGNEFPHFRENWVFRTTYNYDSRYFAEVNGAYNGSEKFGANNRFAFFPSFSGGWLMTSEDFMKDVKFLEMLKFRASWGRIGDDNVGGRFLYTDQWAYTGNASLGDVTPANTPYTFYRISSLGNPNVSWETVEKRNFGADYSLFGGLLAGSVDVFSDKRSDILIAGGSRAVPSYFGDTPPMINLGKVNSHGYELEVRFNHVFGNGMRLWSNANMTHAVNKVIFRDDPELYYAYQKQQGYPIGQTKAYLDYGYLKSWDDVYGSTERATNNPNKLAGDYNIIDYNGDGVIDDYDRAPYEYTGTPQNTYSASLGFEWKGFSAFVQFYGVNNVTREITFPTFHSTSHVAFVEGSYYAKGVGGDVPLPRWTTNVGGDAAGTRYLYDGSYVRLKNAEIAYTFKNVLVNKIGIKSCRVYLNGDNLLLWTKMPDDRESNFSGSSSFGAYPTVRRFNLGIDITL